MLGRRINILDILAIAILLLTAVWIGVALIDFYFLLNSITPDQFADAIINILEFIGRLLS